MAITFSNTSIYTVGHGPNAKWNYAYAGQLLKPAWFLSVHCTVKVSKKFRECLVSPSEIEKQRPSMMAV